MGEIKTMKKSLASNMKACLKKQLELVDKIYTLQKSVYSKVIERDWLESEKSLRQLNKLSNEFMELDKNLYSMIKDKAPNNIDFFECTKTFSKEEKEELDSLYKDLKNKLVESKIENDSLSNYVKHAQSLVQGMVDIISEERTGKCYTPTGKRVSADLSNIVLDKSF